MSNEKYKVEVEVILEVTYLSVTHSDEPMSWLSIPIKDEEYEIPKIIGTLRKFLRDRNHPTKKLKLDK